MPCVLNSMEKQNGFCYALMQLNMMDTAIRIASNECTICCLLGNIEFGLLKPIIQLY